LRNKASRVARRTEDESVRMAGVGVAQDAGIPVEILTGSMSAAKAAGKVRVEGKDYVVQEGDILHVRFAV